MIKKVLAVVFFIFILVKPLILKGQDSSLIDLSSVDKFFEMTSKISLHKELSEDDWDELFKTSGYHISATSQIRKNIIRETFILAFSNDQQFKRDSLLNISTENMQNSVALLTKLTLINFLDIKKHEKALKAFRKTYDFDAIKERSINKLKSFLIQPVDSFIVFPSINLLCYESDAQSKDNGIVWDFNLFYKQTDEERVNMLAHEMFHAYRAHFVNKSYINSSYLLQQIDKLQDEGIADLIDKPENIVESIRGKGFPQNLIDLYASTYENTPQILDNLDVIVYSFIRREISGEEFKTKMKDFFLFGAHPNGYYMSKLIRKAGLMDEMLKTFFSPVEFLKLYNKAAYKENTYIFSDEFINFVEKLRKS